MKIFALLTFQILIFLTMTDSALATGDQTWPLLKDRYYQRYYLINSYEKAMLAYFKGGPADKFVTEIVQLNPKSRLSALSMDRDANTNKQFLTKISQDIVADYSDLLEAELKDFDKALVIAPSFEIESLNELIVVFQYERNSAALSFRILANKK
jgi:hypothetical protein